MEKRREEPSDLVALADLVHAPRECSEGSEEDGDGAWALVRDAASEPDRCEPARRWTVLENRHVLHAHHPWLVPYMGLRHLFPISSLRTLLVWNIRNSNNNQQLSSRTRTCFVSLLSVVSVCVKGN